MINVGNILQQYNKKWVALSSDYKKVLASDSDFKKLDIKVKKNKLSNVIYHYVQPLNEPYSP